MSSQTSSDIPFPWDSSCVLGIRRFLHTPRYDAYRQPSNQCSEIHKLLYPPVRFKSYIRNINLARVYFQEY